MADQRTAASALTIRPFDSLEDYEACTDFQEEIWGRGFSEKVSAAILMIANRIGGLSAGAFDQSGKLHGFVFGLTGVVDGGLVHWSDMLGVRDTGRDRGLGTRLKTYQREVVLGWGIQEMRWTFDPLQGRNANVNFSKLGIVCREYAENLYGQTDSPLHRGIGTDRMVALWELGSERVETRLAAGGAPPGLESYSGAPQVLGFQGGGPFPLPGEPELGLDAPHLLLNIPVAIEPIMDQDMALAIRWREATREAFVHYIQRGYEVREFLRGGELSSYLLVGPDAEGVASSEDTGGFGEEVQPREPDSPGETGP